MTDWTEKNGRCNSSPEYERLCKEVERTIRGEAHSLIAGRADQTARLIVARLAHVYGMHPDLGFPAWHAAREAEGSG